MSLTEVRLVCVGGFQVENSIFIICQSCIKYNCY